MIYRIGKELIFPQPVDVEPDGLLCIGGDLSVDRLLLAYSHGIFPWFSFRDYDEPLWYCPQQRFVIFPEEIHVSHSMRTLINKGKYDVSICFIGESMFSLVPSASKLALIFLAEFMQENGGLMIDCQIETPHLKSMGGRIIPYTEYMKILQQI